MTEPKFAPLTELLGPSRLQPINLRVKSCLIEEARRTTRILIGILAGVAMGLPAGFVAKTYLPFEVPDAINHRKGRTMWEMASQAGMRVQVIRVPATFPAEPVEGNMISGLGVPDMRGRVGTPTYYTSDPAFQPGSGTNEFSLELVRLPARSGKIETKIVGPVNKPFYDFVVDRRTAGLADGKERSEARRRVRQELDDAEVPRRLDLPLTLDVSGGSCAITVSGRTHTLGVEWSDWFVLKFPVNWLVDRVLSQETSRSRNLARRENCRDEVRLFGNHCGRGYGVREWGQSGRG